MDTTIKPGIILKNLIQKEPVKVTDVKEAGDRLLIEYVGMNTSVASDLAYPASKIEDLEVISKEGAYNFEGDPEKFKIYMEAERLHAAFQFDPLFAVNCSLVEPLPHQVEAVYKYLLPLPQIRFLLADDTGAGKTIMSGLLLKEMMLRNLVERVLIVVPGGLTKQWQNEEMYVKFNLSFKVADRAAFNSDPAIFANSPRLVTSMDFIRNEDVLNAIEATKWDMIIVDEAHKLSAFEYASKRYLSKRYKAVHSLSKICEHLLLLTATPHRGRKDTFKFLMQLLDEDIFASNNLVTERVKEFTQDGVNKFFIRRLKEEMKDWNGNVLFRERYTRTAQYKLTSGEKELYEKVTKYLLRRREDAKASQNIHVSLAINVMQRRLTSSIYAIRNTLYKRYSALSGLVEELNKNPDLWKKRQSIDASIENVAEYEALDDEERESLDNILADPKKFKFFTTASTTKEIKEEMNHVKELYEMADKLYTQNEEEQKLKRLRELLTSEGVLDEKERLVIFTEHKDTLEYLSGKLRNDGYQVVTIHGGMNVDERQEAQRVFAHEAQILVATDAAGEGINLQFCRLLINWDIPWNPNRLEQRMGRIHRYGQKDDVVIFNLVAQNTREGKVLDRLLSKMDNIRNQLSDDRVYDVISDLFSDVGLDEIVSAFFEGEETQYNEAIENRLTKEEVQRKIEEQRNSLATSGINYDSAFQLKEESDEKRLHPLYIRMFFENAFNKLGGSYYKEQSAIFKVTELPESVAKTLKDEYNLYADIKAMRFCFEKDVFLSNYNNVQMGSLFYINPGNPLFDSVLKVVSQTFREEAMKGTMLVSAEKADAGYAFVVKSQLTDNRPTKGYQHITDEQIHLVKQNEDEEFETTSPAKIIDLHPPKNYELNIGDIDQIGQDKVREWVFKEITLPQYDQIREQVAKDVENRKAYLQSAFTQVIADLTAQIEKFQHQLLIGTLQSEQKLKELQDKIEQLKTRREERLEALESMLDVQPKKPEVIGCIYIAALSDLDFENNFGMKRDDAAEQTAMKVAINHEREEGRTPEDVSANNEGYDIKSTDDYGFKRYIEVKGRSHDGGVMLSENELYRLAQLKNSAWLYVVSNCKTSPALYKVQDPGNSLNFERKVKGVQFLAPEKEWKTKSMA